MRHRQTVNHPEPPAANDSPPGAVAVVTAEQLQTIVTNAVAAALASGAGVQPNSKLLGRDELARALACSPSTVGKLRRDGMPFIRVGDSPRYDLDECLTWIRKNQKASNQ